MIIPKAFGRNPTGARLIEIKKSSQYNNDGFQNLSNTPMMLQGVSYPKIIWKFFNKPKNTAPPAPIPSVNTDLKNLRKLSVANPVIVWFGHSSYLIHIDGLHILVDPVFSGHASPFGFMTKSFRGSDAYTVEDLPEIDVLILTHDHYDHLDYETVSKLKAKTKMICTSLGVGAHLEYWGWKDVHISEFDWWTRRSLENGLTITAAPARHFSGRGLTRSKTFWSSFILQKDGIKIFVGGDSGYDNHFLRIGESYGPFDLVILECGQYNEAWPYMHLMPEQTVHAAMDLRANLLLPVHWGKFALSLHAWDEPIRRAGIRASELNMPLTSPMIGEPIILKESIPTRPWWEMVIGH